MKQRSTTLFIILSLLLVILFMLDLLIGSVHIPLRDILGALFGGDVDASTRLIVLDIRLIKAIVAVGDDIVINHINKSIEKSPSLEKCISIGPKVPEGWEDFHKGIESAAPFVKPECPNKNDDISLMYFTSGTTGNPKMVIHDFTYPLAHIITGSYWHNLNEESLHLTLADTGWGKAVWGKLY